jgi:membrane protein DedA with SNARE-associated domain
VLHDFSQALADQVTAHGVYGVFVLMLIDAVFPTASELVMLYGGAVAAGVFGSTHVSLFGAEIGSGVTAYIVMALAGTIGYLVGSLIGWWIGYKGGRPFLERRGRWLHLSPEKLDKAERWFDRWGNIGVLVGRMTPVIRSFVSIPAGVFRVPLGPYAWLTAIGSAVWAFGIAGAGYGLGSSYEKFHHAFRYADYTIAAGVVVCAAYFLYRWRKAATVRRRAEDPAR